MCSAPQAACGAEHVVHNCAQPRDVASNTNMLRHPRLSTKLACHICPLSTRGVRLSTKRRSRERCRDWATAWHASSYRFGRCAQMLATSPRRLELTRDASTTIIVCKGESRCVAPVMLPSLCRRRASGKRSVDSSSKQIRTTADWRGDAIGKVDATYMTSAALRIGSSLGFVTMKCGGASL